MARRKTLEYPSLSDEEAILGIEALEKDSDLVKSLIEVRSGHGAALLITNTRANNPELLERLLKALGIREEDI